ncbi:cell wall-binding protein [Clostridium sp. C2-6-12]|uniref:cell wall-binding protein n=1 Tax=Clostridium sp. C2-6-12 TaxID=2698832 RepID=UPI001368D170|nr:cell wall-binding protein [Clostridium sp. C2-6-12]
MQKFKRLIASFMMALSLLAITPVAANAEWRSNSTGWWYTEGNSYATGWRQIEGKWYYFYSDGYMAHDEWIGDYYLGSSGAWTSGSLSYSTNSISTTNDKSQIVYVASSGNGKKYHSNPKCSNMKDTRHITLSEAQSEGYGPCSKCY